MPRGLPASSASFLGHGRGPRPTEIVLAGSAAARCPSVSWEADPPKLLSLWMKSQFQTPPPVPLAGQQLGDAAAPSPGRTPGSARTDLRNCCGDVEGCERQQPCFEGLPIAGLCEILSDCVKEQLQPLLTVQG